MGGTKSAWPVFSPLRKHLPRIQHIYILTAKGGTKPNSKREFRVCRCETSKTNVVFEGAHPPAPIYVYAACSRAMLCRAVPCHAMRARRRILQRVQTSGRAGPSPRLAGLSEPGYSLVIELDRRRRTNAAILPMLRPVHSHEGRS